MTEYSKVLYLDSDVLPIHPLSEVFETPFAQDMYGTDYLFAAAYDSQKVRDSGKFTGPIPKPGPKDTAGGDIFAPSMFLLRPSEQHARYVRTLYHDPTRAKYFPDTTEDSLLRYAYREEGPYPWKRFSHTYNTQWPRLEDLTSSHAIRGKFWINDSPLSWDLKKFWYFAWGEMRGHAVNDIIHGRQDEMAVGDE
jgi:alpha-N-acetylglucosamine transferase